MTTIDRNALLPFPAAQVFALVSDIESYPLFMDGCVGAQVLRRTEHSVEARLDLAKGGIRQSFSTCNRFIGEQAIELELLEGPFERFTGRWEFQPLGEAGCKVSLRLQFRLNSRILSAAAGSLVKRATNNLVTALARRAQQVYG